MFDANKNQDNHHEKLLAFSTGITGGENGKELIEKYKDAIDNVSPFDIVTIEDMQFQMGINILNKNIKNCISLN